MLSELHPTGLVSGAGAGKYVNGNLKRTIPAGASTATYDIGDATNYTPVALSFAAGTTSGNLTIQSIGSTHPDLSTSNISATKNVKRYWSICEFRRFRHLRCDI